MRGWGGGEGRSIKIFLRKFFVPQCRKKFVGQLFKMSLISGNEKFYASEGYVNFFRRIFLSHSAEKFRSGTLLCSVPENFR